MIAQAKKAKSDWSRLDLLCALYCLLRGQAYQFKLDRLADLRARGQLKMKVEYFEDHKFRLSVHKDPHRGKRLDIKQKQLIVNDLATRQELKPEELVTVLYMYVLSQPGWKVMIDEADFRPIRESGAIQFKLTYAAPEKEFFLTPEVKDVNQSQIILPSQAGRIIGESPLGDPML
jgi:hypothetical protein